MVASLSLSTKTCRVHNGTTQAVRETDWVFPKSICSRQARVPVPNQEDGSPFYGTKEHWHADAKLICTPQSVWRATDTHYVSLLCAQALTQCVPVEGKPNFLLLGSKVILLKDPRNICQALVHMAVKNQDLSYSNTKNLSNKTENSSTKKTSTRNSTKIL